MYIIIHVSNKSGLQAEIRRFMKQLDREKISLEGQLRDLEWRLDNESKVGRNDVIPMLSLDIIIIF